MRSPLPLDLPISVPSQSGWPWSHSDQEVPHHLSDGRPWPKVTIITPSYNQGPFIEETIRSVLLQVYPNLEYFVMDGGSTDNTVDVIKKYEQWLTWVSEPDRGQSHAINKALRRATGDVVAWLNSDDVFMPGAVPKAVDYLMRHPEVGMVYAEAYYIDEHGRFIGRYPTISPEPIPTCGICQPTVFIRRLVVEEVGYLDESLNYCIDYDLWIRISKKYTFGYFPEYLAKSRLHEQCKTISQRVATHKEAVDVLYRHYGFVPSNWLGGYVREVLSRRFARSVPFQRVLFVLGFFVLGLYQFLRYNRRLPLRQLGRELKIGVRKFWRRL